MRNAVAAYVAEFAFKTQTGSRRKEFACKKTAETVGMPKLLRAVACKGPYTSADAEKQMVIGRAVELRGTVQTLLLVEQSVTKTDVETEVGTETALAVAAEACAGQQAQARFGIDVYVTLDVESELQSGAESDFITPQTVIAYSLVFGTESAYNLHTAVGVVAPQQRREVHQIVG